MLCFIQCRVSCVRQGAAKFAILFGFSNTFAKQLKDNKHSPRFKPWTMFENNRLGGFSGF
jgi:hypothetical protein